MKIRIPKIKFTSRKVLKMALTVVGVLTLIGVALLITNEKNLHDTITDIIILLVGTIALMMAVLTEAELERQENRSKQIHREVLDALAEIRDINKDSEYLKRKMREGVKLDKEISEKIDEIKTSLP